MKAVKGRRVAISQILNILSRLKGRDFLIIRINKIINKQSKASVSNNCVNLSQIKWQLILSPLYELFEQELIKFSILTALSRRLVASSQSKIFQLSYSPYSSFSIFFYRTLRFKPDEGYISTSDELGFR